MSEQIKLSFSRQWRGRYRDVNFKIMSSVTSLKEDFPSGAWCMYLYLEENKCRHFEDLWLEDKITKFSEKGREYITHDYMTGQFLNIDFHYGITFYAKHGYKEGFRYIEIGCDYSHLHDLYQNYDENDLTHDAKRAIDSLYSNLIIKENEKV
jgi:hypothetical protein